MDGRSEPARRRRRLSLVLLALVVGGLVTVGPPRSAPPAGAITPPGTTERVSVTSDEAVGPLDAASTSTDGAVSADGRWVVFASDDEYEARDLNGRPDVYLRDRRTGRTILVSRAWQGDATTGDWVGACAVGTPSGCPTPATSTEPSISANGRFVVFTSDATNLDPGPDQAPVLANDGPRTDVFVYDRDPDVDGVLDEDFQATGYDGAGAPTLRRMPQLLLDEVGTSAYDEGQDDLDTIGEPVDVYTFDPSISADGRHVVMAKYSQAGASGPVFFDVIAIDRDFDVDGVYDEFAAPDPAAPQSAQGVSMSIAPGAADNLREPEISADGRWIAVIDTASRGYSSVQVLDRGPVGTGFGTSPTMTALVGPEAEVLHFSPVISGNGRVVAFASNRLIPPTPPLEFPIPTPVQITTVDRGEPDMTGSFPGTPTTELASRSDPATPTVGGNISSGQPDISDDGRYVSFFSYASNFPHPPCSLPSETPVRYCADIFVYDRGRPDLDLALISTDPTETQGGAADSTTSALAADGRAVAFSSQAGNLVTTPADDGDTSMVFVRGLTPELVGTPNPTDFGTIMADTTTTRTVTFQNVDFGPLPLRATNAVVSTDPRFTVTADTCSGRVLHADETCLVEVTFSPDDPGPFTGTLVAYGPEGATLEEVALQGTGGPRPIGPIFDATPDPADFAPTVVGSISPPVTVTVRNLGDTRFTVNSVAVDGTDAADFTIVGTTCSQIVLTPDNPPGTGATCTVDLTFAPGAAGLRTAVLRFVDTAPGNPHLVVLRGQGIRANPIFRADPVPLDLGSVLVDGEVAEGEMRVFNDGNAPYTILGSTLIGDAVGDFTVVSDGCTPGLVLGPTQSCLVVLRFDPGEAGLRNAALRFDDTAPGNPHAVPIRGTGAAPVFRAAPVDFGSIPVDDGVAERGLRVFNDGDAPMTMGEVVLTGSAVDDYTVVDNECTSGLVLGPDQSCVVRLELDPSRLGPRPATARVADSAPGSPHAVGLRGVGIDPGFRAEPDPVDYGTVLIGEAVTRTVTVTNTGDGPLAVSSVTLRGPDADDFAVVANTCLATALDPDDTCEVDVRIVPSATGARTAALRFTDNANGSPHDVDLEAETPVPALLVNPGVGPPGAVVTVLGVGWSPGRTVTLGWEGSATVYEVTADADGVFTFTDLLVFPRSSLGTRMATGASTTRDGVPIVAATPFLVVPPSVDGTPQFVFRK